LSALAEGILQAFMHPLVPFLSVALYWFLSKPFFSFIRTTLKIGKTGQQLSPIVLYRHLLFTK
jgi:hypothetical protein